MTTAFEVPVAPGTPQTFTISLAGTVYTLTLRWNAATNSWVLDIGDPNNNPIVSGIPVVTGANLLEQYGYLNFGGGLYTQSDGSDPGAVPTFTGLGPGTTGHLFFVTEP